DGLALGVGRLRSDGSELPEDHGPSAALDAQSPSGTVIDGRKSWRCDEGRVDDELSGRHRSFNYERGNAQWNGNNPLRTLPSSYSLGEISLDDFHQFSVGIFFRSIHHKESHFL